MHIVVCVKHIADPEAPWVQFLIDGAELSVVPLPGVRWLMSPFDEQALEAALRIRDAQDGVRVTALTLGAESSRAALKHALAMGADDGVLLCDPSFEGGDAWTTACAIAAAVHKLGHPGLVLTGRQSADWDGGVVGSGVAELLDWPVLTFASDVQLDRDEVRVERVVDEGIDTLVAALPAVVTVSNELGKPRIPNLRETMRATRKPVQTWDASDLGLQGAQLSPRTQCTRVYAPVHERSCEFIHGDSARDIAAMLATRLRAASLV